MDDNNLRMKILQVIPHLGSGGAERFVVDLSNELVKQGHEVVLLTFYDLEGKYGFYKNDINKRVKQISLHKSTRFSLKCVLQNIDIVQREKPDVIHSHVNSLQYTILPQVFMAKGVHTVHNEAHLEASGRLEVGLRKFAFKHNLIQPVTISQESHDSFLSFYGKEAVLINNGRAVDSNIVVNNDIKKEISGYKKSEQTRVIIQLARFQSQKNIPMMARVANHLYNEGYEFCLLFIGSTENKLIVDEVKSLMPPCAHILGEKNNPLEYLKEADAFALTSLYEGMPISLLEALAVGAIPVCTPVGGIPNAVTDGDNGFLSADNTESAYYQTMKRFLETDSETLNLMSQKAERSFAPYSMVECAGKYLQLYESLILNKKK